VQAKGGGRYTRKRTKAWPKTCLPIRISIKEKGWAGASTFTFVGEGINMGSLPHSLRNLRDGLKLSVFTGERKATAGGSSIEEKPIPKYKQNNTQPPPQKKKAPKKKKTKKGTQKKKKKNPKKKKPPPNNPQTLLIKRDGQSLGNEKDILRKV